jgi:hypothetical protein
MAGGALPRLLCRQHRTVDGLLLRPLAALWRICLSLRAHATSPKSLLIITL